MRPGSQSPIFSRRARRCLRLRFHHQRSISRATILWPLRHIAQLANENDPRRFFCLSFDASHFMRKQKGGAAVLEAHEQHSAAEVVDLTDDFRVISESHSAGPVAYRQSQLTLFLGCRCFHRPLVIHDLCRCVFTPSTLYSLGSGLLTLQTTAKSRSSRRHPDFVDVILDFAQLMMPGNESPIWGGIPHHFREDSM